MADLKWTDTLTDAAKLVTSRAVAAFDALAVAEETNDMAVIKPAQEAYVTARRDVDAIDNLLYDNHKRRTL